MVEKEELESFTYDMAIEISENAPLSLKGTKRVLELLDGSSSLSGSARNEEKNIAEKSFLGNDIKEGQAAFFEKRKPVFKGD